MAVSAIAPERADLSNLSLKHRALTLAASLAVAALVAGSAHGQILAPEPPAGPPPGNPVCQRLEGQLAVIDRGGMDPAKADQIRRYEDAQAKQQAELDRLTNQARRMGCDSTGFLSLFNGQSAQCGPINGQIQQMRGNLDQITNGLQQLRGAGNPDRDNQRRSVLISLAQNNCGPQYVAAARAAQQQDGIFGGIFGGNGPGAGAPPADSGGAAGTFRTVCARSCDGYYFPISFATVPSRFPDDERACKSLCPAADATLFTYRNPGEDMNQAVSLSGQPYSSSPNAFHYRTEFNPSCSCKAAGQSWADALKNIDDKSAVEQQGDIIVTEDRAKKMSQPIAATKPPTNGQKKGASSQPPSQAQAPAAPAPAATSAQASGDPAQPGRIRSVGPTFLQQPQQH